MSIEQFLENLTLEEIEELKRLKLEKSKIYNFSKIDFNDLNTLFEVEKNLNIKKFDSWFNNSIYKFDDNILNILESLIRKHSGKIESYNEEDLKAKIIIPILNMVNFELDEFRIRDFYDEKLTYKTENFILSGRADFMIAKGLEVPQKPYFFIQEFKKSIPNDDPRPQLIAELISAIELNNFNIIKGAYIVGAIWNFVILEKINKNKYQYYVSENFDSSKIEDLKKIYKNLLFIKNEIIALIKSEL